MTTPQNRFIIGERNVMRVFCSRVHLAAVLGQTIGTLRNYDGDGKENVKKAIGLMSKKTTAHVHHAFLYISLLSLHNYDVKWSNFIFTWERERQSDLFYYLCPNSGAVPSLQLRPKFPSVK